MNIETKLLIAVIFIAILAVDFYALKKARHELKNIDLEFVSSHSED